VARGASREAASKHGRLDVRRHVVRPFVRVPPWGRVTLQRDEPHGGRGLAGFPGYQRVFRQYSSGLYRAFLYCTLRAGITGPDFPFRVSWHIGGTKVVPLPGFHDVLCGGKSAKGGGAPRGRDSSEYLWLTSGTARFEKRFHVCPDIRVRVLIDGDGCARVLHCRRHRGRDGKVHTWAFCRKNGL